jgi:hypothetical protein
LPIKRLRSGNSDNEVFSTSEEELLNIEDIFIAISEENIPFPNEELDPLDCSLLNRLFRLGVDISAIKIRIKSSFVRLKLFFVDVVDLSILMLKGTPDTVDAMFIPSLHL